MALGILFISIAPGYMPDMTSYLFGDILSVSTSSVIYMAGFTGVVALLFGMLYNHLMLYLFDEEYAIARGVNVRLLAGLVYIILPIGIIVLVKVVGIILTIALMTIPVSIAKLYCKSFGKVVMFSMLISFLFCMAGLTLAYYANIPSGVCIVILGALFYFLLALTKNGFQRLIHKRKVHMPKKDGQLSQKR
jgi:zinc transport system permease protein